MGDWVYAWRQLRRAPGFAAIAVMTLGLAIGANTAIFSLVAPMLVEPLPYPKAQRIVEVTHLQHGQFVYNLDSHEALYLAQQQRVFANTAVVNSAGYSNLTAGGGAVRVFAVEVTHGFFRVWGVAPGRGRDFSPADDEPGAPQVAILSYGLWQKQFGGSAEALGRTFQMNGREYTVIGIMPKSFETPIQNQLNAEPAQLWTDLQPTVASLAPLGPNLDFIARLKPQVTLAEAQANLTALDASFHQVYPQIGAHMDWGVRSMHATVAEGTETPLLLLLGAVGLVLLIACANIANLLLARASGRGREMAIRAALGAGRRRIVRQLLTESVLLAGMGAVLGWLLAWWAVPSLGRMTPAQFALPLTGHLNLTALLFTLAVTVGAAILFGLAPALHSSRVRLQAELQDRTAGAGGTRSGRARSVLIAAEVALAFLLLAGAGLLAASLVKLHQVNPGFDLRGVLTAQTALTGPRAASDAATTRYTEAVLERLRRLPGVASAASITGLPLTRAMNYSVKVPGHENDPRRYGVEWRAVSPGYFATLRIGLLRGRGFTASDSAAGAPVAIVNARLARHFWPQQGGLGQMIGYTDPKHRSVMAEVVGIAGDVHEDGVDEPAPYTIYLPQAQATDAINALVNQWFSMGFVIRGGGAGHLLARVPALGGEVRQAFAQVDANQPVFNVRPLASVLGESLDPYRFIGQLLGGFAVLALLLGAIGIYGVLAYAVEQQRREIGIRMALGAERGVILKQFLEYGIKLAAIGLAAGVVASVWLMRLLSGLLFGVSPSDPWVLAATGAVLVGIAALASLRPALVATRVDPLQALRSE
ncbi:MAG: ABC transporter permease [Terriglobales bacterium]